MIPVTKPFLPPQEEYLAYVAAIWQRMLLTNHGPLVQELEERLRQELQVKHVFFVCNGTLALQLAIRALALQGEVLTTPFSYVATSSAIAWEGCTPVYADIEPSSLCLDPARLAEKITPRTSAILATHVFGNPCDVAAIAEVAAQYQLPVIYDAAHAFGVRYQGKSLVSYGTISTLSFHATKLFHTVEGGALVTNDDELARRIAALRNFGQHQQEIYADLGVNAKNSELHAAMGLSILPYVGRLISWRQQLTQHYDRVLAGSGLARPAIRPDTAYNYAYYPVLFPSEEQLLQAKDLLRAHHIMPRRYFYPALNLLPYVEYCPMPVTEDVARRILCLPLYEDLRLVDVARIGKLIRSVLRTRAAAARGVVAASP